MANSTTNLDLISQSQAQKEVAANALFDAASPAMLYGRRASACAGMTWGYYGGNLSIGGTPTAIANGTVTLTNGATNIVQADPATGAVSVASSLTSGNIKLYTVVTSGGAVTSYADHRTTDMGAGAATGGGSGDSAIIISLSGETSRFYGGTDRAYFRAPFAFTIAAVKASLYSNGSTTATQVDINNNGSSILSTKLTIDAGETTSASAATPAVISSASVAADDILTFDIDAYDIDAMGLKVTLVLG